MKQPALEPRLSAAVWLERDAELLSGVYARYSDLVVDSAQGSHLFTVDGRDVLDFGSGIGVTNLGHGHPALVAALHAQVDKLWHTSVTAHHPKMIEAAAALVSVAPEGLDSVFFNNSGAEAIEAAIKLSRRATGRSEIIAFAGGFHGRTYGAMSLTASKAKYRTGMGPFLPGVHHVAYPHCFRMCHHGADEPCPIAAGEEIQRLFETIVPPESVAAIVVEPVQGEGGYIVPPATFLPGLRRLCDEHGILLVADEVQSGFARTGRMFAVDHWGVVPDIMCVAKGLGNGVPIGGIVAKRAVMSAWRTGENGSTFGGNPLACATAAAVIETIQRERLEERAARVGAQIMARARGWKERFSRLADVRGLGMMIGLEFMEDGRSATAYVQQAQRLALARDVLVLTCGIHDNVIRLIPPLTIPEDELDAGLDALGEALAEAEG